MYSLSNYMIIFAILLIFNNINSIIGSKNAYVTCGTVLKLQNRDYSVRLHSHEVQYGTGSGQQSITATELTEDVNSHWNIRAPTGQTCDRGQPIKCGATIRLTHLSTNKNLHSHHFTSPLSNNQEISCYGSGGEGDTGDHWEVVCNEKVWERSDFVNFKHVDTGYYLAVSGHTFGRPINGQMEVVGYRSMSSATEWKAAEGLFIHPREGNVSPIHTEL